MTAAMGPWAQNGNSNSAQILLNPRLPEKTLRQIESAFTPQTRLRFPEHFGLLTSGSTRDGEVQIVLLSREALEVSADAVNDHLQVSSQDRWFKVLPDYHVGGLAIWVRADRARNTVMDFYREKWNPEAAFHELESSKCTLTALVPTQLFDWVERKFQAPPHLRAVVIGGAALSSSLHERATQLGWPLLPSYGMTECGSQVATAFLNSSSKVGAKSFLPVLSHIQCETRTSLDSQTQLYLRSSALLTARVCIGSDAIAKIEDPKVEGWFATGDRAEIYQEGSHIFVSPLGRIQDFIKIGGEGVDLQQLNQLLSSLWEQSKVKAKYSENLSRQPIELLPVPDQRLDYVLHAVYSGISSDEAQALIAELNANCPPFARVRATHSLSEIPRSELGKFQRLRALREIGF